MSLHAPKNSTRDLPPSLEEDSQQDPAEQSDEADYQSDGPPVQIINDVGALLDAPGPVQGPELVPSASFDIVSNWGEPDDAHHEPITDAADPQSSTVSHTSESQSMIEERDTPRPTLLTRIKYVSLNPFTDDNSLDTETTTNEESARREESALSPDSNLPDPNDPGVNGSDQIDIEDVWRPWTPEDLWTTWYLEEDAWTDASGEKDPTGKSSMDPSKTLNDDIKNYPKNEDVPQEQGMGFPELVDRLDHRGYDLLQHTQCSALQGQVTGELPWAESLVDDEAPEQIIDDSPSRKEWLRQKRERGEENKYLDQVMSMVGHEDIKAHFLLVKERYEMAKRWGDDLDPLNYDLVFQGKGGTGKSVSVQKASVHIS